METRNARPMSESSFNLPMWLWVGCLIAVVAGVIALALAFHSSAREGWLWLIVDFVVFLGIANGAIGWAAVFRVAQTRWAGAVNRLGHAMIFYMPLLFGVLIALLIGVEKFVPWVEHPIPEKAAWLNVPFFRIREVVSLGLLWILFGGMVSRSLTLDAKTRSGERIASEEHYRLTAISVTSVIWYTIAASIVSYDFIMSLSPKWVSTMFAPYFWVTNLYMGMAFLILSASLLRNVTGARDYLGPEQFHDMGNLLLGFSLFSMGLFFAQYLTIWYENLPEETHFLVLRYDKSSWMWLGWAAFIIGYGIPFLLLQSRHLKKSSGLSIIPAVLVLIGVSLERYVLIVPSVQPGHLAIYPLGAFGALAFLGALVLTFCIFLRRYPPISSADVALKESDMVLEVLQ